MTTVTYEEDVSQRIASHDPTHLNNVEPLPRAMAAAFPQFAPGDLLVSLRNVNTIAVIDPHTKRLKWSMTGGSCHAVSSGCIRLTNEDVIDLYDRVKVGDTVVVRL